MKVALPFNDTDTGMTPTRTNVGVTQMASVGLMFLPVTTMLSKRQERRSKHGPETVIGDPPSNGARLGESLSGPA